MSLIADALKSAQQDREAQRGADEDARERYASSAVRSTATVSVPKGRGKQNVSWPLVAGGVVVVIAWIIAGMAWLSRDTPQLASTDATPASEVDFSGMEGGGPPASAPEPGVFSEPSGGFDVSRLSTLPGASYLPFGSRDDNTGDEGGGGAAGLLEQVQQQFADRIAGVSARIQGDPVGSILDNETVDADVDPAVIAAERSALSEQITRSGEASDIELTVQNETASSAELFREALEAQQYGDNESAIELYRAYVEQRPGDAEAYNNLGTVLQAAGNLALSRTAFERALSINPQYAGAWSNLGVVLQQLGDDTDAMAALNEAARLEPSNVGVRVNLALLYERMGMIGDARAQLESVLETAPRHPEAHYAIGRLLDSNAERMQALSHYRLFLSYGAGRFPAYEEAVRSRIRELEQYGIPY